jgi:UDP-N-acetylmuramoyl-tripeptide--D-alanyl-D-alanine ligase
MKTSNPFARGGFIRTATKPWRREAARRLDIGFFSALSRLNRPFCRGRFIAITGSSAKTTTASLLGHVLSGHGRVRSQFVKNTIETTSRTVASARWKDDYVVIEAGTSGKGRIAEIARVIRPDVAIVTLIGLDHYSAFRTREAVAEEKASLVAALRKDGLAVLNADDDFVRRMAGSTEARSVTYGRAEDADFRVTSVIYEFPGPLDVEIAWQGRTQKLSIPLAGEHFAVAVAAAFAAAIELGVAPQTIAERMSSFEPVFNRCHVYRTEGGPTFLLDAVKSPLGTLGLAIDVVARANVAKKRIVLGHLADYAGSSRPAYRKAYRMAREAADQVIFTGPASHRSGASEEDRASERFLELADARSVYEYLRSSAGEDELVLLKGSARDHLERVALAYSHDVKCWAQGCGFTIGCRECGMYEYPLEEHARIRRRKRRENWKRRFLFPVRGPN